MNNVNKIEELKRDRLIRITDALWWEAERAAKAANMDTDLLIARCLKKGMHNVEPLPSFKNTETEADPEFKVKYSLQSSSETLDLDQSDMSPRWKKHSAMEAVLCLKHGESVECDWNDTEIVALQNYLYNAQMRENIRAADGKSPLWKMSYKTLSKTSSNSRGYAGRFKLIMHNRDKELASLSKSGFKLKL